MNVFRIFEAKRATIVAATSARVVSQDICAEAFVSADLPVAHPLPAPSRRKWWHRLGPGLVTGASDDDPSAIATYSQVGAQFGYGMGWTMLFSYPLMVAIQEISARLGCITHHGIASNIRRHYPTWLLRTVVGLLVVANVINLGSDIGGMGAALKLLVGGSEQAHALVFGLLCVMLMVCLNYARYVAVLKWLCLSLFAYVATVLMVQVPWDDAMTGLLVPSISFNTDFLTALVAVLGTTISPYLFFWQSQHEVEERRNRPGAKPLRVAKGDAPNELRRIRLDTLLGMGFSNLIALFIIIATAATLNAQASSTSKPRHRLRRHCDPLPGISPSPCLPPALSGPGCSRSRCWRDRRHMRSPKHSAGGTGWRGDYERQRHSTAPSPSRRWSAWQ